MTQLFCQVMTNRIQDQITLIYKLRKYTVTTQYLQEVLNRRRVVYYAILLIIILGELLGEINYIIVRFLKYDRSTGRRKKVVESRGREGSTHGQAMRDIARIEEKFSGRVKEESRGALWQRSARESIPIRIRMVHKRSDSDVCAV